MKRIWRRISAWPKREYYKPHGWHDYGFITPDKAQPLGLAEIIPDMQSGKTIYKKWVAKQAASN
ncbi:MAG TPA: hypothetical protein VM163_12495 [bacterium]|nr:hypothetical protein [bacterium]